MSKMVRLKSGSGSYFLKEMPLAQSRPGGMREKLQFPNNKSQINPKSETHPIRPSKTISRSGRLVRNVD